MSVVWVILEQYHSCVVLFMWACCWLCEHHFKMKYQPFEEKSAWFLWWKHVLVFGWHKRWILYSLQVFLRNMRDVELFTLTFCRTTSSDPAATEGPLKTSTVLSAINIAVLNFWMSDEGIEADPDESMNEWWWVDWKSPAVRADTRSRGSRSFWSLLPGRVTALTPRKPKQ